MFRIPAVAKFLGFFCFLKSAHLLRHHAATLPPPTSVSSSSVVVKTVVKSNSTGYKVVEKDARPESEIPAPDNATGSNSRAGGGAKQDSHLRTRDSKVSKQSDSPLDFRLENLNLSAPASCGVEKCFFRENGENPRVGYLVQQEWPVRDLAIGERAWNFAKRVEKEFDVLTLFGPVQMVRLSESDASKMNSNLIKESQQMKIEEGYYEKGKAVVFSMKIAPQPSLLLGVSENKVKHALSHLQDVIAASGDKAGFLRNLRRDVKKALALAEEEPCLVHDFQVLLDSTGRLHHIDFDRCYHWSKSKKRVVKEAANSEDREYYRGRINDWIKSSFDLYIRTAEKIISETTESS